MSSKDIFANIPHVVWDPRPSLFLRCAVECLGALHGLHIEVGHVVLSIRQLHADLELRVKHHVVLPQPPWAIVDTHDALLHLHLLCRAAPRKRVVLALLAARGGDCDTALGEGEACSWTTNRLCDLGGVATPDVLRCADTSGMC